MDNNLIFKNSFQILKKNKKLAIPFISSNFFMYSILIIAIISSFGLSTITTLSNELSNYQDYVLIEQSKGNFFYDEFDVYLQKKEVILIEPEELNVEKMLTYAGIGVLIWYFINIFFINIGYYQNVNTISQIGFKRSFSQIISEASHFFFKLFFLRIIALLVIFVPFIGLIFLSSMSILLNPILGVIIMLIAVFGGIFWLFYASIKLFFAEASLYYEEGKKIKYNPSSFEIISFSFKNSKGKFKSIFLTFLIVMGINTFAQSVSSQPVINLFVSLFQVGNIFLIIILIIILIVILSIILGFINTYTNLYLLRSYIEIRSQKKDTEVFNN